MNLFVQKNVRCENVQLEKFGLTKKLCQSPSTLRVAQSTAVTDAKSVPENNAEVEDDISMEVKKLQKAVAALQKVQDGEEQQEGDGLGGVIEQLSDKIDMLQHEVPSTLSKVCGKQFSS